MKMSEAANSGAWARISELSQAIDYGNIEGIVSVLDWIGQEGRQAGVEFSSLPLLETCIEAYLICTVHVPFFEQIGPDEKAFLLRSKAGFYLISFSLDEDPDEAMARLQKNNIFGRCHRHAENNHDTLYVLKVVFDSRNNEVKGYRSERSKYGRGLF